MNTGYYDLDKIINLNNSQLIACTSADYVIEPFLSNILKNVSVEQKIPALYIDNYLMRDCNEAIKKEREIILNNQNYEIELIPELMEVSDNTLDDIVSNITMINKFKIMDNRIVETVLSELEIENLKTDNTINLIEVFDGTKFTYTCELFNTEEKEKVREADELLKSSPIYLKHVTKISLSDFKEICYEYKNNNNVKIILLNNINTIDTSNEIEILSEVHELSKNLNIPIMIGYDLIKRDAISLENELENVKQKCKYLDTILFLKNGGEEDKNILHIWTMKNINNKLGKISLLYLDEYNKCINLAKIDE